MKNIKYLEIGFENLESIVIPKKRILEYRYDNLEVIENDPWDRENVFYTKGMHLEISYDSEEELKYNPVSEEHPLGMFVHNPISNNVKDRPHIIGRILNTPDIVSIEELDENKVILKTVYVPWGEEEYRNEHMKVNANEGVMKILVNEDINEEK